MKKVKQYWAQILMTLLLLALLPAATEWPNLPLRPAKKVNAASDKIFADAVDQKYSMEGSSALAFIAPDKLLVANAQRDEIWLYQLRGPSPHQPTVFTFAEYKDAVAPVADPGPAALLLSDNGLIVAEIASQRLSLIPGRMGLIEPLATNFGTRRLHGPKSAVFGPGCAVYFADSPELPPDGHPDRGSDFGGIYRLDQGRDLSLVSSELNRPVALAYSYFCQRLYAANGDPAQSLLLSIELKAGGKIGPSSVFADLTPLNGRWPGRLGPLLTDQRGYVYAAGPGGIHAFDPAGRVLSVLPVDNPVTAMTWGKWENRQELYFASNNVLYKTSTQFPADRGPSCKAP